MVTKTIPIQTDNLLLRKITMDDAIPMFNNWASDNEVTKYLNWHTHNHVNVTREVISAWINQYSNDYFFQWVIEHTRSNEIIGTISLFNKRDNSYEIGYCIAKNYWNKGLTTEACGAVIDFAFTQIGADKITSRHVKENIASGRVMQKNGMVYTGTNLEFISSKNKREYMSHYVIKKEEFK